MALHWVLVPIANGVRPNLRGLTKIHSAIPHLVTVHYFSEVSAIAWTARFLNHAKAALRHRTCRLMVPAVCNAHVYLCKWRNSSAQRAPGYQATDGCRTTLTDVLHQAKAIMHHSLVGSGRVRLTLHSSYGSN